MTYHLVGQKFGHLIVIEAAGKDKNKRRLWLCKCECGKEKTYPTYMLTGNKPASTCHNCEDHINRKEAYISWMSAKSRCLQPTNKDYPNYGGRGITFSEDWIDFKNFYRDMGDPPFDSKTGERTSLDRIENDKGYNKDNCGWATRSEQQLNKCKYGTRKIENGELQS